MKKITFLSFITMSVIVLLLNGCSKTNASTPTLTNDPSLVYMTEEITPESLVKIFNALGLEISDTARVAIKISTGESKHSNHLRPEFIAPLQKATGGRLVECNTAYGGNRSTTASHKKAIAERGYGDVDNG